MAGPHALPIPDAGAGRPFSCFRRTPFGPVAVIWSVHGERPMILRVLLSKPGAAAHELVGSFFPGIEVSSCPEVDDAGDRIEVFLAGHDVSFSLDIARMDLLTGFQRRVLLAEYAIPRGSVSTYGRIAAHLGTPSGARAVGTALATNPFPILVPCHRAVRSDGMLGGYQGGLFMKRTLLSSEGVAVSEKGRVETRRFHYGEGSP